MRYRFGAFEINETGELRRDGKSVRLQPQPSRVLYLLVSHAGNLVTREEIQRDVWDEGTFVDFQQGLNWCIRRIREVLGDDAANPTFIETVPRRGYRFIAALAADMPAPVAAVARQKSRRTRTWLAIGLVLVGAAVFSMKTVQPSSVTVLVIPFDDLGSARADVATEEVINTLGQIDPHRLSVIDPVTAMKFKRTGECIIHMGKQLHAQYVLLGAVRKNGSNLRSTTQLFRVADNRQIWAATREIPFSSDPTRTYDALADEVAGQVGILSPH
jgi:DNA-binding winged helix-turn-helix (wHTH) protein/TolB-like protein